VIKTLQVLLLCFAPIVAQAGVAGFEIQDQGAPLESYTGVSCALSGSAFQCQDTLSDFAFSFDISFLAGIFYSNQFPGTTGGVYSDSLAGEGDLLENPNELIYSNVDTERGNIPQTYDVAVEYNVDTGVADLYYAEPAPEPATLLLTGSGILLGWMLLRRRSKARSCAR